MIERSRILLAAGLAIALTLSSIGRTNPLYIWNASGSIPIGLYRLQRAEDLRVTELVAIRPEDPLMGFLDLNGYLPIGVPMLKRVLALPGQTVCRTGSTVSVDHVEMGDALERDGRGRPLPVWKGCHVLSAGQVFVMNWSSADSFDGRYFGPISASTVIGQAIPVWTREE
jgi:conjugative transfer signal peptidase TraF